VNSYEKWSVFKHAQHGKTVPKQLGGNTPDRPLAVGWKNA